MESRRTIRLSAAIFVLAMAFSALPSLHAQSGELLIVADASGSMKGFATKAPRQLETLFRVLPRHLERSMGFRYGAFGAGKEDFQFFSANDISIVKRLAQPGFYRSPETHLADAIPMVTARSTSAIIVSDGLESENLYGRLEDSLASLAAEGWGVWIMLIPMPFEGSYDIEQPLDIERHLPRMRACVGSNGTLSIVPGSSRAIRFDGERPVLLFVLFKNVVQGREHLLKMLRDITNELRKPQVVELSPLYMRGYKFEAIESQDLGVNAVGNPPEGAATIVADPKDGPVIKRLAVRLGWGQPAPAIEIVQPFQEQWALLRLRRTVWGDVRIDKNYDPNKSPGGLTLVVSSSPTFLESLRRIFSSRSILRDGDPLRIQVKSNLDKPVEGWWRAWNSETSWECPQRVFKLSTLIERVSTVARERLLQEPSQRVLELKLQIGPD